MAHTCSEMLVTTHNVSLRIREDLGPSLLHASPAEHPTYNNREKRDVSLEIDLFRKKKDGRDIPHTPRTNMPMAIHTVKELQSCF